jgi:glutamate synthase domain-containing protein 3
MRDLERLLALIGLHRRETRSELAKFLLSDWPQQSQKFWIVVPKTSAAAKPVEETPAVRARVRA